MPAYWIAHVTVTDPERYRGYMALAPEAFRRHGARFLARGGPAETLEGPGYDRHVVIEFPDLASARACWASPEYARAKAERDGACVAHVCIVEGAPPEDHRRRENRLGIRRPGPCSAPSLVGVASVTETPSLLSEMPGSVGSRGC